jgi:hypothetical protein
MKKTIILLTFLFAITSQLFSSENKQSEYLFDIQYKHIIEIAEFNVSLMKKLNNGHWIGGHLGLPLDWDDSNFPNPTSFGNFMVGITYLIDPKKNILTPRWLLQISLNYSEIKKYKKLDMDLLTNHIDLIRSFNITNNSNIFLTLGITKIIYGKKENGESKWFGEVAPTIGIKYGYYFK